VIPVAISISAPATVRHGSVLHYTVTVANQGDRTYQLSPCPDYFQFIGGKLVRTTFALNCGPVGAVSAGTSTTFAMEMEIPAWIPTGPSGIRWGLSDGRISPPDAFASIQVVA
jgi:hypothetical protein